MIYDLTPDRLIAICSEAAESAVVIAFPDDYVISDVDGFSIFCGACDVQTQDIYWETAMLEFIADTYVYSVPHTRLYFRVWFAVWEALADQLPDPTPPESAPAARIAPKAGERGYVRKITDVEDPYSRTAFSKQ
jgi:hypothetical protein